MWYKPLNYKNWDCKMVQLNFEIENNNNVQCRRFCKNQFKHNFELCFPPEKFWNVYINRKWQHCLRSGVAYYFRPQSTLHLCMGLTGQISVKCRKLKLKICPSRVWCVPQAVCCPLLLQIDFKYYDFLKLLRRQKRQKRYFFP